MSLEVLYFAFMLLGLLKRGEGAKIAALAGLRILLTRVQAKRSGFEFPDHVVTDEKSPRFVAGNGSRPRAPTTLNTMINLFSYARKASRR
jgi:hypothetical protein